MAPFGYYAYHHFNSKLTSLNEKSRSALTKQDFLTDLELLQSEIKTYCRVQCIKRLFGNQSPEVCSTVLVGN